MYTIKVCHRLSQVCKKGNKRTTPPPPLYMYILVLLSGMQVNDSCQGTTLYRATGTVYVYSKTEFKQKYLHVTLIWQSKSWILCSQISKFGKHFAKRYYKRNCVGQCAPDFLSRKVVKTLQCNKVNNQWWRRHPHSATLHSCARTYRTVLYSKWLCSGPFLIWLNSKNHYLQWLSFV